MNLKPPPDLGVISYNPPGSIPQIKSKKSAPAAKKKITRPPREVSIEGGRKMDLSFENSGVKMMVQVSATKLKEYDVPEPQRESADNPKEIEGAD